MELVQQANWNRSQFFNIMTKQLFACCKPKYIAVVSIIFRFFPGYANKWPPTPEYLMFSVSSLLFCGAEHIHWM